jgi:annexin A7/11
LLHYIINFLLQIINNNTQGKAEVATIIHKALTEKDNDLLISYIARYENEDLIDISEEYLKKYGIALSIALKDAGLDDYSTLLVNLVLPRANFIARTIHNAITGAGTDEVSIIDAVAHLSEKQVRETKEAYAQLFQRDLSTAIAQDLSGHFRKVVASLLDGKKHDAVGNPDAEAEALYKKGEGVWGTDDDFFVEFFTRHSFASLQKIDHAYQAKYKHSLEVAVKKETSGAYQDILQALVVPREVYWARRIRNAIAGLGTDDTLLRRAFVINSKAQLAKVNQVYETVNKGKTLRSDVADDTSGYYKALYLAILDFAN